MGIDLARSWMVGDQERDVQAGQSAGCKTILVSQDATAVRSISPTATAHDFTSAVKLILDQNKEPKPAANTATNGQTAAAKAVSPDSQKISVPTAERSEDAAALRRTM